VDLNGCLNPEATRALVQAVRMLETASLDDKSSSRVLLTTHVNPDGDAVGSTIALAHALRDRGTTVDVVLADPPPVYCKFLPGVEWITPCIPSMPPDLAIVCDAAGIDRIGPVDHAVKVARQTIEIDHHGVARPFGDVRVVDDNCAATAELVYYLLTALKAPITPAIASSLMMGLVTDTGSFRFTNTNTRAFRLAATLMEAGADLSRIMDQVYDQKTVSSLRLLERAISHLRIANSFASATLSRHDFQQTGATQGEAEGVIGHLRSLKGVQVAAVLRETGPAEARVSLRGRPGYNVAEIAALMGGGGHAAAAGCTIYLPLDEAERRLRETVYKFLDQIKKSVS